MSEYHSKRTKNKNARRQRAHLRVRKRVNGTPDRPRLAVYKSLRYIYAQVIDDVSGRTLAQASSFESELNGGVEKSAASREAAKVVGEAVARRAKEAGVETVVFDRGRWVYHGRVQAVAEGARSGGLKL